MTIIYAIGIIIVAIYLVITALIGFTAWSTARRFREHDLPIPRRSVMKQVLRAFAWPFGVIWVLRAFPKASAEATSELAQRLAEEEARTSPQPGNRVNKEDA